MQGMNQNTGKFISNLDHLQQSIKLILSTPLGSRVMLPEFGSKLVNLIDTPMTNSNQLKLYAATIEALDRWEPRLKVKDVKIENINANGVVTLNISGVYDERDITVAVAIS